MRRSVIISLLLALAAFTSCDERNSLQQDTSVKVKISVDWNPSKIVPYGATFYVYDLSGVQPARMINTHTAVDSLYLKKGEYACIVFNETTSSYDGITFSGMDSYDTATASLVVDDDHAAQPLVTAMPAMLSVGSVSKFVVSGADVVNQEVQTINVTPRRVTVPISCELPVEGLTYVSRELGTVQLTGCAKSVKLATQEVINDPVYLQMPVVDREFITTGTKQDGILHVAAGSFGFAEGLPTNGNMGEHFAYINLKLRNKEMMPTQTINISENATWVEVPLTDDDWVTWKSDDSSRSVASAQTKNNMSIEYRLVITPQAIIEVPEVPDTENPGSGFDADVDDWGDPVEIPVDVD